MKLLDSLTFITAFNRPFLPMPIRNVAIFVSNSTTRMVAHFVNKFDTATGACMIERTADRYMGGGGKKSFPP